MNSKDFKTNTVKAVKAALEVHQKREEIKELLRVIGANLTCAQMSSRHLIFDGFDSADDIEHDLSLIQGLIIEPAGVKDCTSVKYFDVEKLVTRKGGHTYAILEVIMDDIESAEVFRACQ